MSKLMPNVYMSNAYMSKHKSKLKSINLIVDVAIAVNVNINA